MLSIDAVNNCFRKLDACYRVLVIPTIRPECISRFIREWNVSFITPDKSSVVLPWDAVVVVCDMPEPLAIPELDNAKSLNTMTGEADKPLCVQILSRRDIADVVATRNLSENVFSFGDSAIRCFGYWWAWQHLCQDETSCVIFSIDDDCYPAPPSDSEYTRVEKIVKFIAAHMEALTGESSPRWQSTVPGIRVRGLPYVNLGGVPSVLNVGLWENVLDLDASDTLGRIASGKPTENLRLEVENYTWNPHCIYPMSGMNIAFRSEITPFMYYPKQGIGTEYGRFDDIWCGLIVQRMCGVLGLPITCGKPYVWHSRASNVFANLAKEAKGVYLNEHLWTVFGVADVVGAACEHYRFGEVGDPASFPWLVRRLGDGVQGVMATPEFQWIPDASYVSQLGESIQAWSSLFDGDK